MPVNMLTSTRFGTEMKCLYGDTLTQLLEQIYDIWITYPDKNIVRHANEVKSCFKQMKLHPDIIPAFSIIIADFLYLQSALPFGTDFSPQNWEPVCRLIDVLVLKLFTNKLLITKHRKYMEKLQWEPSLGKCKKLFVTEKLCQHTGVLDASRKPLPTPQKLFVDDSVYAHIYKDNKIRIEQIVAADIKSIFILLGFLDL